MELWERVLEAMLSSITTVTKNQFGFMLMMYTEEVHLLIRLMEKYKERNKELHTIFINLEKVYDSARKVI